MLKRQKSGLAWLSLAKIRMESAARQRREICTSRADGSRREHQRLLMFGEHPRGVMQLNSARTRSAFAPVTLASAYLRSRATHSG
jgi:hypothetical protein